MIGSMGGPRRDDVVKARRGGIQGAKREGGGQVIGRKEVADLRLCRRRGYTTARREDGGASRHLAAVMGSWMGSDGRATVCKCVAGAKVW